MLLRYVPLLHPEGISCHTSHICHSHMSFLGRTIGFCPTLLACLAPSVHMTLVLKNEVSSLVPAQKPLGPVSELHGVFINKSLHFTSEGGGATKGNSNILNVLGVS